MLDVKALIYNTATTVSFDWTRASRIGLLNPPPLLILLHLHNLRLILRFDPLASLSPLLYLRQMLLNSQL